MTANSSSSSLPVFESSYFSSNEYASHAVPRLDPDVECTRHTRQSRLSYEILALTFREKSLKPFKLLSGSPGAWQQTPLHRACPSSIRRTAAPASCTAPSSEEGSYLRPIDLRIARIQGSKTCVSPSRVWDCTDRYRSQVKNNYFAEM